MSTMQRVGRVGLCNYNGNPVNVIDFPSPAARDGYFDGKSLILDNLSYVKNNTVQVAIDYETARQYNYLYFAGVNNESIRYYAFIRDIRYVNNNNTEITFDTDLLMTYLSWSTPLNSFIRRFSGNVLSADTKSIPDIVYNGEYDYQLITSLGNVPGESLVCVGAAGIPNSGGAPSAALSEYYISNLNTPNAQLVFIPILYSFFEEWTNFRTFMYSFAQNEQMDLVVDAFIVPKIDVDEDSPSSFGFGNIVRQWPTISIPSVSSFDPRIVADNFTIVIAQRGNFENRIEIPYSELSGNTLTVKSVSQPIAGTRQYYVTGGLDGADSMRYLISIPTSMGLPTSDNAFGRQRSMIQTNFEAKSSTMAIDKISAAAAGAGVAVASGAMGNPLGVAAGIGAAAGSLLSIPLEQAKLDIEMDAALTNAKFAGIQVSGNLTAESVISSALIGVDVFLKKVPVAAATKMASFYRTNGYVYNQTMTPAIKNSIKAYYEGTLHFATARGTMEERLRMEALFDKGVWLWPSESGMYNY